MGRSSGLRVPSRRRGWAKFNAKTAHQVLDRRLRILKADTSAIQGKPAAAMGEVPGPRSSNGETSERRKSLIASARNRRRSTSSSILNDARTSFGSRRAMRALCLASFARLASATEGYFSIFKRGMIGVYQHCSKRHLHRYLAEFDFRYSYLPTSWKISTRRLVALHLETRLRPLAAPQVVRLTKAIIVPNDRRYLIGLNEGSNRFTGWRNAGQPSLHVVPASVVIDRLIGVSNHSPTRS